MEMEVKFLLICHVFILSISFISAQTPRTAPDDGNSTSVGTDTETESTPLGVPDGDSSSKIARRDIEAVTILHTPYVMVDKDNKYSGLVIDILHHMQQRLHLNIKMHRVSNGHYGIYKSGKWDGMMNELIMHKNADDPRADIAAGPMAITSERQKYVTFLHPFKHGGLVGLMLKPHLEKKSVDVGYFNVLRPLGNDVWIGIIVACVVVAVGLWLLNQFNPYEWGGRYNIGRAPEAASESFNATGSLWFAFTTLHWQGFDRMPRSIAGKVLSIFWFAFVTLVITTYTASVVNHLFWASTKQGQPLKSPFVDFAHLANSHDELHYEYGIEKDGPAYNYILKTGLMGEYAMMYQYWLQEGKNNLVTNVEEGLKRVRKGQFVLITDLITAEYFVNQQPCDLLMITKPVTWSYGMAVSKDLPKELEKSMRSVMLEMAETGQLDALEDHWFKDMSNCWNETQTDDQVSTVSKLFIEAPKQITLSMLSGTFIILTIGIILSLIVLVVEIFYYKQKGRYNQSNQNVGHQFQSGEDIISG